MSFDNKARIDRILRFKLLSIILFAGVFAWIYYAEKNGLSTYTPYLLGLAILVYVILVIIPYVKNAHYLSFSNEPDHFSFRYYAVSNRIPKAAEISKSVFKGYRFKKEWMGLRENLIISIETPQGIAEYPPISTSFLSVKQRRMLEEELKLMENSQSAIRN